MLFSCFDAGDILRVRSVLVRAGRAVLKPMLVTDWPPRTLRPQGLIHFYGVRGLLCLRLGSATGRQVYQHGVTTSTSDSLSLFSIMLFNALLISACGLGVTAAATLSTPTASTRTLIGRFGYKEAMATAPATSTSGTLGVEYYTSTEVITIKAGTTNSATTVAPQTIQIAIPTCVQTITPDKNGHVPPGTCNALWDYYPNFGAAVVFSGLFGLLVVAHIWQAAAYHKVRTPRICRWFFASRSEH